MLSQCSNYNVPDSGQTIHICSEIEWLSTLWKVDKIDADEWAAKKSDWLHSKPATVGILLNWWRRSTNPSQAQIHCLHFSLLFAAYITDDQPIASNSSWHVERIHIVCCVYTWIFAWIDCVRIWRKNIYGLHATCGKWAECVWIWLMDIVLRTHTHTRVCWLASRATRTMCQFQSINFAPNENPMWTLMTDKNVRVIRLETKCWFFQRIVNRLINFANRTQFASFPIVCSRLTYWHYSIFEHECIQSARERNKNTELKHENQFMRRKKSNIVVCNETKWNKIESSSILVVAYIIRRNAIRSFPFSHVPSICSVWKQIKYNTHRINTCTTDADTDVRLHQHGLAGAFLSCVFFWIVVVVVVERAACWLLFSLPFRRIFDIPHCIPHASTRHAACVPCVCCELRRTISSGLIWACKYSWPLS